MPPQITVDLATDPSRFVATDNLVWFTEPDDLGIEEALAGLPPQGRFAASIPGETLDTHSGIYGVRPMWLSVPGEAGVPQVIPVAGLTWVGVHPDHRRQGVLTAMMRDHFQRSRESGVAVSILHASEPVIYGRFGYGLASLEHAVTLTKGTTLTAPGLEDAAAATTCQIDTASDPVVLERLRTVQEHFMNSTVGMVVGEAGFYQEEWRDRPHDRRGTEPLRVLFARRDGQDVGAVLLRRSHRWERARPTGRATAEALYGDAAARLALLRRLVDLDLAGVVELGGIGIEDPLLAWLPGPRGASALETYDNLWVRLVDLPAALTARGYAADADLVLEVADTTAPWNAGRWRFVVQAGTAQVDRTDAAPDVSLVTDLLGAVYLGGRNLLALHEAGVLTQHRGGAVRELWQAIRTDRPPTAAIEF